MRAGRLRHRLVLQAPSNARNAAGELTESWTTQATVWAAIEPVSGSEKREDGKAAADVTHTITMRNRSVPPTWRGTFSGRTFYFVNVLRRDERAIMLEIQAQERPS